MFNGKSFNEKFLLTRKYYDFACAINCTRELTYVCAYARACDCMDLREQYVLVRQAQIMFPSWEAKELWVAHNCTCP